MRRWMLWTLVLALVLPYGLLQADQSAVASAESNSIEGEAPIDVYTDRWKVIPQWNSPPSIDGLMDEAVWSNAAPLDQFVTAYYNEPAFGDPSYKVAYDERIICMSGGTFSLEEKQALERIEIVISPQASGELHYVAAVPVSLSGRTLVSDWNPGRGLSQENPQRVQIRTFDYQTSENNDTFTMEAAIPMSTFEGASFAPGSEWRMNIIQLHQLNTKPLSSWVPIRSSVFTDTSTSVRVIANVVDEGRLGSIYFSQPPVGQGWTPPEYQFDYINFTTKRLTFKRLILNPVHTRYELKWKSLNGDWQQLNEVQVTQNGEKTVLNFSHPEPLKDGLYQLQLIAHRTNVGDEHFVIFTFDRENLVSAGIEAAYMAPEVIEKKPVVHEPASAEVQRILELIPDRVGFRFTGLPEMPELHPDTLYRLSADGKSMVATKTGTVYPNAQYPEDKVVTAVNRKGETVEYPYYEDENGKKYFLSGHLWYLQKEYTLNQTKAIAAKDPLGAARLLYRYAQVYEGYVPTTDYIWYNSPLNITAGPPFNYWGGMWSRWSISDLNSFRPLMNAYAEVKKTDALQVLSQEVGVDVEKMLLEKVVVPSIDYVLGSPKTIGNMNYTQWLGLLDVGRAVREPDYIHLMVEWMRDYVETQFLSDGFWKEITTSYHNQSTNGLDTVISQVKGYSDPEGYISPRSGVRFDDLDVGRDYPIVGKAQQIPNLLVYPDGKTLPIMDTWANERASNPQLDAGSFLLPASGIGRLSLGQGADQSQVYMGFQPKYGHTHYDPLNLNLYAEGQELLPDLGYTYTKYRYFTTSTLGHNTVVVNSRNMPNGNVAKHGGNIEAFAPVGAFQAMRADYSSAYAETEEYSREPWFISFPGEEGGKGYVLDLFRVSGGDRHEYTLNGDAMRDAVFETDLPLSYYGPHLLPPGTPVTEAENFNQSGSAGGHYPAYIYVKDVRKAELTGDQYEVTLATSEGSSQKSRLKITGLLEDGSNELYLGRSPSIRPTRMSGKSQDTNDLAVNYDMPKLVLRRDGTNLKSTFVTALEPYAGNEAPKIEQIERLQPTQAPEGAVAVKVTYGDITDYLLSSPEHPDQPLVVGDITMKGEMGFIRVKDGVVQNMYLVGGTQLKKGIRELNGTGYVSGDIVQTMRKSKGDPYDAIVTNMMLDQATADSLRGRYVVVTHPDQSTNGFKIGNVIVQSGRTIIELAEHDPGFEIAADGSSHMMFVPFKEWNGTHTFRIADIVAYDYNPLHAVGLNAAQRHLLQGQEAQLSLTGVTRDGQAANLSVAEVSFTSSDPSILKVDGGGKVTGVGSGTAVIRAEVSMNGVVKAAELVMSSQKRANQVYNIVDLNIADQTVPILYVSGSNTVQFEANSAGQSITFEFDVKEPAEYELGIKPFKATSYGQYRISVDGVPVTDYDFYASRSGAVQEFEVIGTLPLTAGTHQIKLENIGKNPSSSNYKFGLREMRIQEPLQNAPVLQPAAGTVYTGEAFDLTFADSEQWRQAITRVSVDGIPLQSGQYTVSPGRLTIAAGALPNKMGTYWIVAEASDYSYATVAQTIVSTAALGSLAVSHGVLSPAFSPDAQDYAVMVHSDVPSVTLMATTHRPDAVFTVTGQTYGGGTPVTVDLVPGENSVSIQVTAANGKMEQYRVVIHQAMKEEGTITGRVVDTENQPLSGATVSLVGGAGHSAVTDSNGSFTIPKAPLGSYQLLVTKLDYVDAVSAPFVVEIGQTTNVDVVIQRSPVPILSGVTAGGVAISDPVSAASSRASMLHLVPASTAPTREAIEAATVGTVGGHVYGSRASAPSGGVTVMLPTAGLEPGPYVVYAIDDAGAVSAGSPSVFLYPREMGPGIIDGTSPFITYSGYGTFSSSPNYYGGTEWIGREKDASVEIPFYGTRGQVLGTMASNGGLADIYVDGEFVMTYDYMYRGTGKPQQVVFDTGKLPFGYHTIKIVVTGEKNPLSLNIWARFDALVVSGD